MKLNVEQIARDLHRNVLIQTTKRPCVVHSWILEYQLSSDSVSLSLSTLPYSWCTLPHNMQFVVMLCLCTRCPAVELLLSSHVHTHMRVGTISASLFRNFRKAENYTIEGL